MKRPAQLLLTCEHGGRRIPRRYAPLFRGAAAVVNSHRGWDPGALELTRLLGRALGVPVHAVMWCRLLVESNRAPTNPRIWSPYTAGLPAAEKAAILERYWWPHRRTIDDLVRDHVKDGFRVVHIAVHSFTPVLAGVRRNADIGLLYDPRSPSEKALCRRWKTIFESLDPSLRVRLNYPYRGADDGLPTWLRRRYSPGLYAGVELEVNQALVAGKRRKAVQRLIAASLEALINGDGAGPLPSPRSPGGSRRSG
jgi:predicted N-formylglutamate amidohydrolase